VLNRFSHANYTAKPQESLKISDYQQH